MNRGFGPRPPAAIRREEIKARTYRFGYRFAMIFAAILGIINANQTIDVYGSELAWSVRLVIVAVAVFFTLLAFKAISKSYLTAAVDLDSFRNRGEWEINRCTRQLGLLFVLFALPSIFLRMDTGLPEVVGAIFWIGWEFITVMVAALTAIATEYYSWSSELARKYEEAMTSLSHP